MPPDPDCAPLLSFVIQKRAYRSRKRGQTAYQNQPVGLMIRDCVLPSPALMFRYIAPARSGEVGLSWSVFDIMGDLKNQFAVPSLYLFWGLAHNQPKQREWRAPSGMRIHGHVDHFVPFSRARVILIYLATKSLTDGQTFDGSLDEIVEMFRLSWPMGNLEKHFFSVVNSEFECSSEDKRGCICAMLRCSRRQKVVYDIRFDCETRQFRLTVSREFWRTAHYSVGCPIEQVQRLVQADQLASLDLLIWYRANLLPREWTKIDALGPLGPFASIKTAAAGYRKRKELLRLHTNVVDVWPDCPFHVVDRCNRIEFDDNRPQSRTTGKQHLKVRKPSRTVPNKTKPPFKSREDRSMLRTRTTASGDQSVHARSASTRRSLRPRTAVTPKIPSHRPLVRDEVSPSESAPRERRAFAIPRPEPIPKIPKPSKISKPKRIPKLQMPEQPRMPPKPARLTRLKRPTATSSRAGPEHDD